MSQPFDPPSDEMSPHLAAHDHYLAGRYADAIMMYSRVLRCDAHDPRARIGRALAFQQLSQHEAAIDDFGSVIQNCSAWDGLYTAYYGRACVQMELGYHEAVVDDCNEALLRKADHIDSLYLRGTALKTLGQTERAVEDMNAVLQADSAYYEAYYARGTACYLLGQWEDAIRDLTDFLRYNSSNDRVAADCYRLRGIAGYQLGRHDAALEDLSFAIRYNPSDGTTYLRRSQVHAAIGNEECAETDFQIGTLLLSKACGESSES